MGVGVGVGLGLGVGSRLADDLGGEARAGVVLVGVGGVVRCAAARVAGDSAHLVRVIG